MGFGYLDEVGMPLGVFGCDLFQILLSYVAHVSSFQRENTASTGAQHGHGVIHDSRKNGRCRSPIPDADQSPLADAGTR